MMKKIYIAAILAFLVTNSFAQVKTTINKSAITFKIKNMGINCTGVFNGLQADVQFKPADLASSSIIASVETATINTDNEMRDNHLKSADYFDITTYPKITLKSVSFKHKGGDNYTGSFNVTIKDKTKLIEIPFTYTETGITAVFSGSFKINRRDFGLGGNSMVLADEATVTVNTEISK
ncbi:YceI family protein [Mucilaginibacter lappiensis]|uniref:Polyisoprenoid-binding protein YceI n=1 Tax=Mucilaginibacter lappiensis TaxID=354630 RepID=A0A841JIJ8_9SPHI|nr:YceI family protein [Mucilaginibacter lappiensis]MBB6130324.1 polyisoprenoid-binding protein YceI [Mucilaginibacter lappiensis]